jgi:pSer/pThr/pTyr-binding forkhead associated (FHA) protein
MSDASPLVVKFTGGAPSKRQFGERLRLIVKEGAPANACFCLFGNKVVLGREVVCDLQLEDEKISRKHIEFTWKSTSYHLKDLGSQNGFIVNGQRVTHAVLNAGDTLVVGATILEVQIAGTVALKAQSKSVKATKPTPENALAKNRMLVIGGVVLILVLLFTGTEERVKTFRERANIGTTPETTAKPATNKDFKASIDEVMPNYLEDAKNPDSEVFFKSGVRELQSQNYRRALTNFDTALSINPGHDLAKIYREMTKKQFKKDVETQLAAAIRARKSGRLREARMHYQTAFNLLEGDKDDPIYVQTEQDLNTLSREERGEHIMSNVP